MAQPAPTPLEIGSSKDITRLPWRTDCEVKFAESAAPAAINFDDRTWYVVDPAKILPASEMPRAGSVCWYRLSLQLQPGLQNQALQMQAFFANHEVFINGQRIGGSGGMPPESRPMYSMLYVYPIPGPLLADGSITIAIRVWNFATNYSLVDAPGVQFSAKLGYLPDLTSAYKDMVIASLPQYVPVLLGTAVGLLALGLFNRQRERREYLWLGLYGLSFLAAVLLANLVLFRGIPAYWGVTAANLVNAFILIAFYEFFFAFLRRRAGWWLRTLEALMLGAALLAIPVVAGVLSFKVSVIASAVLLIPAVIAIFTRLFVESRRKNPEAALLLVPTILALGCFTLNAMAVLFGLIHVNVLPLLRALNPQFGFLTIPIYFICLSLFWVSTGILIVNRSNRASRLEARLASEMDAARHVQMVLIPEALPEIPGYSISSVYRPAQEVGGDFFQIMPLGQENPKGETLVVVGDVSGKGLKAALAVSLIIGTLRTLAEYERDPAQLLAGLNRRLIGRLSEGFATCAVLRLTDNGVCTLASAGHPAPYRDGKEMSTTSSLPVGILGGVVYDEETVVLGEGDSLVFYTDGVLEARNSDGELYGFERLHALMASRPRAATIAAAACTFGQDDDITVLAVERVGVRERKLLEIN